MHHARGPAPGCTPRCCTALQEGPRLAKLAIISNDILRTGCPKRLSDVQSLLFSCVAMSGMELPWAEAASAHDSQKVRELRHLSLKEGASATLLGRLLPLLRSFAGEHLPNRQALRMDGAGAVSDRETPCRPQHPRCFPQTAVLQDTLKFCCCLSCRGGLLNSGMVQARWGPAGGLGLASAQAGIQVT